MQESRDEAAALRTELAASLQDSESAAFQVRKATSSLRQKVAEKHNIALEKDRELSAATAQLAAATVVHKQVLATALELHSSEKKALHAELTATHAAAIAATIAQHSDDKLALANAADIVSRSHENLVASHATEIAAARHSLEESSAADAAALMALHDNEMERAQTSHATELSMVTETHSFDLASLQNEFTESERRRTEGLVQLAELRRTVAAQSAAVAALESSAAAAAASTRFNTPYGIDAFIGNDSDADVSLREEWKVQFAAEKEALLEKQLQIAATEEAALLVTFKTDEAAMAASHARALELQASVFEEAHTDTLTKQLREAAGAAATRAAAIDATMATLRAELAEARAAASLESDRTTSGGLADILNRGVIDLYGSSADADDVAAPSLSPPATALTLSDVAAAPTAAAALAAARKLVLHTATLSIDDDDLGRDDEEYPAPPPAAPQTREPLTLERAGESDDDDTKTEPRQPFLERVLLAAGMSPLSRIQQVFFLFHCII